MIAMPVIDLFRQFVPSPLILQQAGLNHDDVAVIGIGRFEPFQNIIDHIEPAP
jgi:hypothetical protein